MSGASVPLLGPTIGVPVTASVSVAVAKPLARPAFLPAFQHISSHARPVFAAFRMSDPASQLPDLLAAGQMALEAGRYEEAAETFARAAAAFPGLALLHQMTGRAWQLGGRRARAREAFLAAWRHADPTEIPALFELGSALLDQGAPREARDCFERVATARPRDAAAWGALASATRATGDPQAAWLHAERALALAPDDPTVLLTAGQIRYALGDLATAEHWLARAAAMRPDHAITRRQQAFASLMARPNARGWALFEARRRPAPWPGTREWHGEPLKGQRIVVCAEQGFGDQFHFLRYVPRLMERGAGQVWVAAAPSLTRLLQANGLPVGPPDDGPAAEWSVPLLSLPYRLGLDDDVASERMPYLQAQPVAPDGGQARTPRRLGVVWQGNPEFLGTVLRDLPGDELARLVGLPGVDWVSLQHDVTVPGGLPIAPMPPCRDWMDTAALLATLDGVVSVDTSLAHLAGAMGCPTWVLLPFSPDWRWGLSGDRTPWYPSVRLIRQPAPLDWRGAITTLHRRLTMAPDRAPP